MTDDNRAILTDLAGVEAFLRHDAVTRMSPGSAPDRALQLEALDKVRAFLSAGATSPPSPDAYQNLKERFAILDHLRGISEIMLKDDQVVPAADPDALSSQAQTLAALGHKLMTAPEVGQWLDAAEKTAAAMWPEDRRNLTLMRANWVELNAVSAEMAAELARIAAEGEKLHTKNRPLGDWAAMKDWYAHSFETRKAYGEAKMAALPGKFSGPYEALLDSFSPGMKDATIAREFARLEQALPALVRETRAKQDAAPQPVEIQGPFSKQQIDDLCRRLITSEGFDFSRGRFDVCPAHPSMEGAADDVRITAKDEDNIIQTIYAIIHEAGHALYEQRRPLEWRHQPIGSHLGMGFHESQSRVMEVQAAHTPEFFQFLEKTMRETLNRPTDPALDAANLERLVNRVEPTFIRIEADEMTYPAHVILRYRIEKAMVEGKMTIDELPKAWNDGMQKMLGITPPDPSQGHMQDVHWPVGLVGYFPAYTIGDMLASQFFAAAVKAHPEIPEQLGQGNFDTLNEWLDENVRKKAASLTPEELIRQATGEDLNADYYLNHLSERYLGKPWTPPGEQPAAPAISPNLAPA